ncbi:MAG TPA: M20/M25/M40 family metallo-hydrolase, partial [Candidatus Polarisedimenticolaceae bacterium]|nr:M20/M25/M40 family metallo-hydrolase [Candidatus Polarisedimenticolaceae bacterium]
AAGWLTALFDENGFTTESWKHGDSNPVVYARYNTKQPEAKTILVYGHYDVQPAGEDDGWASDPFRLEERSGRLYGRGVVDNKGQTLIHIATVLRLIESGRLTHNVIFLIEGNEESGSGGMPEIIKAHQDKLACNHVMVSDGEIPYRPTIEAGVRGAFNMEVIFRTAKNNLHSGIYGGGVPNAAQELSNLLAGFYDATQRVTIPGFYEDIDPITDEQLGSAKVLAPSQERFKEITGIDHPLAPEGYDLLTATGLLPTLQISGLNAGYTGEGFASIIPGEARANINIRTVSSQDPHKLYDIISAAMRERTPDYVHVEINGDEFCDALKLATDTPAVQHLQALLTQAFGEPPVFSYCGGSMPVMVHFKDILDKEPLLISLGNNDCNMHGANENFSIELLEKGLVFSELLFSG